MRFNRNGSCTWSQNTGIAGHCSAIGRAQVTGGAISLPRQLNDGPSSSPLYSSPRQPATPAALATQHATCESVAAVCNRRRRRRCQQNATHCRREWRNAQSHAVGGGCALRLLQRHVLRHDRPHLLCVQHNKDQRTSSAGNMARAQEKRGRGAVGIMALGFECKSAAQVRRTELAFRNQQSVHDPSLARAEAHLVHGRPETKLVQAVPSGGHHRDRHQHTQQDAPYWRPAAACTWN